MQEVDDAASLKCLPMWFCWYCEYYSGIFTALIYEALHLCKEKYTVVKHAVFKINTETYLKPQCIYYSLILKPWKEQLKAYLIFCETVLEETQERFSHNVTCLSSVRLRWVCCVLKSATSWCLRMVGVVSIFCLFVSLKLAAVVKCTSGGSF